MGSRSKKGSNNLNLNTLHDTIASLFQIAQNSNATHKRCVNALCQLHTDSSSITEARRPKGDDNGDELVVLVGEKSFNRAFWAVLLCVLDVKRGFVQADRIIRFVGLFVGSLLMLRHETEGEEQESPADRFFERLVARILPGCAAKDKTVRYRCTQLLSEILRNTSSLDEELYDQVRLVLLQRANDREWMIRAVACIGIGVLAQGEGSSDDSVSTLASILQDICQYDVHPQVRIAALPGIALPLNISTLPELLKRSRDTDKAVRKIVFRVLRKVPVRSLSVAQRSTIVRNGMGDRESSVRSEASKLLAVWALGCTPPAESKSSKPSAAGALKVDLHEFVDLFDLWDGEVAEEAVKALIYHHPDIFEGFDISQPEWWFSLSPSKAVLARIFTQLVNLSTREASKWDEDLENSQTRTFAPPCRDHFLLSPSKHIDSLPVLSLQAITIQSTFNFLALCAQALISTDEMPEMPGTNREDLEEKMDDCIFSLGELLKMTTELLHSSTADEIGKRKVNTLILHMLAHAYFPNTLLSPAIQLLKAASDTPLQFTEAIIQPILDDVIQEQRRKDTDVSKRYTLDVNRRESPDPYDETSSSSEDEASVIEISEADKIRTTFLRLCIINEALRSIIWPSPDHESLHLLQRHLVRPSLAIYAENPNAPLSVKSKIFEEALTCLGLIAAASEALALNALSFCVRGAMGAVPPFHAPRVLDCLFDILVTHPQTVALTFSGVIKEIPAELASMPFLPTILVKSLQSGDENVQAKATLGVCKLHLTRIWCSEELLEALILLYFVPDTIDNQALRQCLAYFFPAFCYSSSRSQVIFSKVIIGAFLKLCPILQELGEQEVQSPDLHRVISVLIELCDPSNLTDVTKLEQNTTVYLASSLLTTVTDLLSDEAANHPALGGVIPLCQALNQLSLSDVESAHVQELLSSTSNILSSHTPTDKKVFKILTLFEAKLRKLLSQRDIFENGRDPRRHSWQARNEKRKRGEGSEEDSAENKKRSRRRYEFNHHSLMQNDPPASVDPDEQSSWNKSGFQGKPKARLRSAMYGSDSGHSTDDPSIGLAATVSRKKRKHDPICAD